MKIFIKKVFQLLCNIIIAFLEANLSLLEDLKSFRNKLVFFTCALVVLIILLDRDYRVMLASLGLFEIFICYYFNNRKIKDANVIEKIVEKFSNNNQNNIQRDIEDYHD